MGPGNYEFFPVTFYPSLGLAIHFLEGKNDIDIDKNRYNFLGSFCTLFISLNPRCSDPKNRRFAVRLIRFLTHVHPHLVTLLISRSRFVIQNGK